jgi:hypothetical protein
MLADKHTDAIIFELVYNYWYDVSIIGSQKLHSIPIISIEPL